MRSPMLATKRRRSMKSPRRDTAVRGTIGGMPETASAPAPAGSARTAVIVTALVSAAAVVADVVLFVASPEPPSALLIVWNTTVAVVWIGAGLVAWARHPQLRTGALMVAVGV